MVDFVRGKIFRHKSNVSVRPGNDVFASHSACFTLEAWQQNPVFHEINVSFCGGVTLSNSGRVGFDPQVPVVCKSLWIIQPQWKPLVVTTMGRNALQSQLSLLSPGLNETSAFSEDQGNELSSRSKDIYAKGAPLHVCFVTDDWYLAFALHPTLYGIVPI